MKAVPLPFAYEPRAARVSPSPFPQRGEKVAAGRMRGAATNAAAANPSPRPSPLAVQREREISASTASPPLRLRAFEAFH